MVPAPTITSLAVNEVTANTITAKLTWSPAAAAGRILYSAATAEPTLGGTDVQEISVAFLTGGEGTIEGLTRNTTYYLRGCARIVDPLRTDGYVTTYGDTVAVTTDASGVPVVTHDEPSVDEITFQSARIGVRYDANGQPITALSIVWSDDH
jgi:hypothetical protein